MRLAFDALELDLSRRELRRNGELVAIEPKVFDLVVLLIENRDRVVSKQDLTAQIWQGRFISESSLSTAVKSARRALGDSGETQRFIKTVHGVGYRFVAELKEESAGTPATAMAQHPDPVEARTPDHGAGRPSIAVLRFATVGASAHGALLAGALPAELISALSRMRWLHVIARGSSFRFDPLTFDPADVSQRLGVGYILTGIIEPVGSRISVSLEMQSAVKGTLVWSDRFVFDVSEIQTVRAEIVAAAISALEITIPQFEAMHSRILSPDQFDAWSHFHIGLTHAFRFSQKDNVSAAQHFRRALELDPHFGRAHAGVSFLHWQNAFMRMEDTRQEHIAVAISEAKRALEIDPTDPFASFCMGRALWLSKDVEASLSWLERGLMINPNFAHGHYTTGLVNSIKGEYGAARSATNHAMTLSPLDPLYYGMLANCALTDIAEGNLSRAMEAAEKAVHTPGTYFYPILWAAITAELAGQRATMEKWRDQALTEWPNASTEAFFQTFPFNDQKFISTVKGALNRMGIP